VFTGFIFKILTWAMDKVLISGGTGLIGKHLCKRLQEKGYAVACLSRTNRQIPGIQTYFWDIEKHAMDQEAIATADYIIHLAGVNIGEKSWTKNRRKEIRDSRVKSAHLIFDKVKENNKQPKAFISASAIGYYGAITSENIFSETNPASHDFLGETCLFWEEAADLFQAAGIRTVKIRTGIVLSRQGGVLAKLVALVKLGIGSAIGDGRQYMPWIHIEDLCNIFIRAIEDMKMNGAFNAVSPDHTTNQEFIRVLAKVLHKPLWFPRIPAILLRIPFGKMADIILKGSRVSSDKIRQGGYAFKFADLEQALKDLLIHS
jgi:uncharacterized protein (TIGR01777 family)